MYIYVDSGAICDLHVEPEVFNFHRLFRSLIFFQRYSNFERLTTN